MTSLVAGRVATVMDPMFTAKMKFQISKSHNSFYYHFTALLNLLRTDDFATGGNGSDFIQLILWPEKKIIRSFALASWPCQHHISLLNKFVLQILNQ